MVHHCRTRIRRLRIQELNVELLNTQPAHTCPAFLSMHPLCKNAKYVPLIRLCPAFLFMYFFGSDGGIQGGEVRLCQPTLQKLRRVQAYLGEVSRVRHGADPGPAHQRGIQGSPGVPQERAAWPGNLFRANLERCIQTPRGDGHGKTGSDSTDLAMSGSCDEHAGALTPDEVLRLFSSNKSGDDDEDVLFQF